jgi:hypothetical protein
MYTSPYDKTINPYLKQTTKIKLLHNIFSLLEYKLHKIKLGNSGLDISSYILRKQIERIVYVDV